MSTWNNIQQRLFILVLSTDIMNPASDQMNPLSKEETEALFRTENLHNVSNYDNLSDEEVDDLLYPDQGCPDIIIDPMDGAGDTQDSPLTFQLIMH